MSKALYF